MKAYLMYRDSDFEVERELPPGADDLARDLELDRLFDAMAAGDEFLRTASRAAVLASLTDSETIRYRQEILTDCLSHPVEVRELYDLIVHSIEGERHLRSWGWSARSPSLILSGAIRVMAYYVHELRTLHITAQKLSAALTSTGFSRLCAMLARELGEEYLASVERHLKELEFRHGVLISAAQGEGLKGRDHVLRTANTDERGWLGRLLAKRPESYTYTLPERDEAGARALAELRDRGVNSVADALAQSVDHVRSFYAMLRTELAFYVGCLNLSARLEAIGEPICLPEVSEAGQVRRSFEELYDVCLALTANRRVVGNHENADDCTLVIITGANQGGKSTFLRSVGTAQLMMQCGMFVGSRSFRASVCRGVFTHFKRQEDAAMESGKLDEELKRMSAIADALSPDSLVLFNESFAATNEREGSEIARQVVRALAENRVGVFFVTHSYDFARSICDAPPAHALFLRAERLADGSRSYRLIEGEPLETSYGRDLYAKIFEKTPVTPADRG